MADYVNALTHCEETTKTLLYIRPPYIDLLQDSLF